MIKYTNLERLYRGGENKSIDWLKKSLINI